MKLDEVPFTLPARREMYGRLSPLQQHRRAVEDVLVGLGYFEVYTPSLVAARPEPERLQNPAAAIAGHGGPADDPPSEPHPGGASQP